MSKMFTANQVNQLYVASSRNLSGSDAAKPTSASTNGATYIGKNTVDKAIYLMQKGAGGLVRSDLIPIANIMSIKSTPASKMERKLKMAKVTINSNALASNNAIAGQDYILRLEFQNPVGMSPDNKYWKYGVVHATSSMTASAFYKAMALSLAKNFSREAVKLVAINLTTSSTPVEVTASTAESSLTGTYTGITIKEVQQDWIRGVKQDKPLNFTVTGDLITTSTSEVYWADIIYNNGLKYTGGDTITQSIDTANAPTTTTVSNGKDIADMEYFYMGERGDNYRMMGWPNYIPTAYLVDETKEYDVISIHYFYIGDNHSCQKSEKDLTIVVPRASTDTTAANLGALATSVLSDINTAIGDLYLAGPLI